MSAISRAMAAPVEMAMPASASDSAGESFTPSPTMMTVCPAAFSLADEGRLVLRQHLGIHRVHADLGAPRPRRYWRLSPVIITTLVKPQLVQRRHGGARLPAQGIVDADHRRQSAGDAQIQVGIVRRDSVQICPAPPSGITAALILKHEVGAADQHLLALHHAGNAVRDHILHLRVVLLVAQPAPFAPPPPRRWPWSGDNAPPGRPPDAASRPPCGRRKAPPAPPSGWRGSGCRSCQTQWCPPLATASRKRPPLTEMWCPLLSRMADSTAMGMASFSAQEKSTISTASVLVMLRVKR